MAALSDIPVLVVDCQATGATPSLGSLLELGWGVARARGRLDTATAHWVTLPPSHSVSRVVRQLTGFRDACRAEAKDATDLWAALCGDATRVAGPAEAAPTVIHFARFELAFLRDLHARIDPISPFPFDVVCLHEVARRLYPELPRLGLRALAGFLGHTTELTRRSGAHVEASAFVWGALVAELNERGLTTWEALVELLSSKAPPRKARSYPLPRERRRALPTGPGVYRFLRSNGDILYVGKAVNVKKRVASHFTNAARAGERALEMLTQAREIEVTPTASALEAALLEADEIKRLDPAYNVELRRGDRAAWFVSPDLEEAADRPSERHTWGPLPSRYSVSSLGALSALLAGADATDELRARAVGAPSAFAPGADVFSQALALFRERHLTRPASSPLRALLAASLSLAALARTGGLEPKDEDADAGGWDTPRVLRHLERGTLQGGQLLRRARWLCVLGDASVAFREVAVAHRRLIVFDGAEIVVRAELGEGEAIPRLIREPRAWRARQASFDAVRYDRLRVLVTELKRVLEEGGTVEARCAGGQLLDGDRLARSLRFV